MLLNGASLFELPVARGARFARVAMVLILDAALLVAGGALILSYLDLRAERNGPKPVSTANEEVTAVEVEEVVPNVVKRGTEPGPNERQPAEPSGAGRGTLPSDSGSTTKANGAGAPSGAAAGATSSRPDKPVGTADEKPDTTSGDSSADGPGGGGGGSGAIEPGGGATGGGTTTGGGQPTDGAAGGSEEPVAPEVSDQEMGIFTNQVALQVSRNRGQLERCYTLASKANGPADPLEGKIDVQFTVSSDGTAHGEKVVANTSGSDQLGRCVAGLVASWSFPPPPALIPVELLWTFPFKAMR